MHQRVSAQGDSPHISCIISHAPVPVSAEISSRSEIASLTVLGSKTSSSSPHTAVCHCSYKGDCDASTTHQHAKQSEHVPLHLAALEHTQRSAVLQGPWQLSRMCMLVPASTTFLLLPLGHRVHGDGPLHRRPSQKQRRSN